MSKEGKITGQKWPLKSKIVVEKQTLNLLLVQCDHVKITQPSFSLYIEESVKKATFHSNNLTSMVVLWFLKSQILRCNHYKKIPISPDYVLDFFKEYFTPFKCTCASDICISARDLCLPSFSKSVKVFILPSK